MCINEEHEPLALKSQILIAVSIDTNLQATSFIRVDPKVSIATNITTALNCCCRTVSSAIIPCRSRLVGYPRLNVYYLDIDR